MKELYRLMVGVRTNDYQTTPKNGLKVAKTVNACSRSDINEWYKYINRESNKFLTK